MRALIWLRDLSADVRFGFKMLLRSPGYTTAAITILALGTGANTAIFSFADALLFRPPAVLEPAQLTTLFHTLKNGSWSSFSHPDFVDVRARATVFSETAAYSDLTLEWGLNDETNQLSGAIVSANYFATMGVAPMAGRVFGAAEEAGRGPSSVAVISERLWRGRLAARPDVIGQDLTLNGHPFSVIGVMPASFRGTEVYSAPDIWVPLSAHAEAKPAFRAFGTSLFDSRGTHWLTIVGRKRPGVTRQQVDDFLASIAAWQSAQFPETNRDFGIAGVPANDARFGSPRGGSVVVLTRLLLAVTGLVLLIACANVANLLLAKSVARRREMAIRRALGAGRGRLVRQLFAESMVLAGCGGLAGLLLAAWTRGLLALLEINSLIPSLDLRMDRRVLIFAAVTALVTGVLFGLAPALQASSVPVVQVLRESSGLRGRRVGFLARHALVAVQVALSMVLLTGAGLLVKTLWNLQGLDPGFKTDRLLMVDVDLNPLAVGETEGRVFFDTLLDRVRALPGVETAGLGYTSPFGGKRMANDVVLDGGTRMNADMNSVAPDYFRTIGLPLLSGRDFGAADTAGSPRVAIVNETFAARAWPGERPIGKRFFMRTGADSPVPHEVVGVVANGRYFRSWRGQSRPFVFLPHAQSYMGAMVVHVRSTGSEAAVFQAIRREIKSLNPSLVTPAGRTAESARSTGLAVERMGAKLLSLFGVLALALAALGVYGVVSFAVSQRTREIGVRVALGASPREVLRLVTWQSAQPILAGALLGLVATLALKGYVASLLFGVSPGDVTTYAVAAAELLVVGAIATMIPARRAARIQPANALRQ